MSGHHSNSRSPSYSPRRSRSTDRSPDERRNSRYHCSRRRSRSDDRGRREISSRFDRGKEFRDTASRFDDRNRRRSSRERNRRDDSRSRKRTKEMSPNRRRDRSRSRERDRGSTDRESYFLVSHRDHIVRNAGKIAWDIRRGEKLKPMKASGPAAVATALGILARVRKFLADDTSPREIFFSPRFQSKHDRREKILFYLKTERGQRRGPSDSEESLTVSSRSKIAPIAGAIAGRARDKVGVLLEAIGDDAVQTCVSAMAMAREFLEDDKITFSAVVTLQEIRKEGKDGISRELINFRVKCYLDD